MKTNFNARPVFHQTEERITAHFLICYTALLVFRLLQARLDEYCRKQKQEKIHLTAENIIRTLQNMEVTNVQDLFYLATYTDSKTLEVLNAVYDLKLDHKYYLPKEMNKKLREIS